MQRKKNEELVAFLFAINPHCSLTAACEKPAGDYQISGSSEENVRSFLFNEVSYLKV